jgi:hypothetical protein
VVRGFPVCGPCGPCGGLLLAALGGALEGLLFGIAPFDPLTFLGVAVIAAAAGLLATVVPALTAMRVDAATALKGD